MVTTLGDCNPPKIRVVIYRYSMALADNVDGGDDLDIIVTTMNGNVFCFQTPAPHHPLKVSYLNVEWTDSSDETALVIGFSVRIIL